MGRSSIISVSNNIDYYAFFDGSCSDNVGGFGVVISLLNKESGKLSLKRQIMGRDVTVAITNGRLDFGPWEQIFYGEFDGRRRKRVLVKIIGE